MIYYIGHLNIEDLVYPDYSELGTAGGAALYAAMGGYLWNKDVAIISRIGTEYPKDYLELLDKLNIKKYFKVIEGETMASVTEYKPGHDRNFMMKNVPAKLFELTPDLDDVKNAGIKEGSYVHIGPLNLDLLDSIVTYLNELKCIISIDTCDAFVKEDQEKFISILKKANYFIPSSSEIMSFKFIETDLIKRGELLMKEIGHPVIIKDSTNGCYVPIEGKYHTVPIYNQAKPKDLTGAGDSFCGAFIANLEKEKDIINCAIKANVTSSLAIEGAGALHYYATTSNEVEKRINVIRTIMEDM